MRLFTDEFKELKKASVPLYKAPKSVQETIEIIAISEDGILQTGPDSYNKCLRMFNVNYDTASDGVQESIAVGYCKFFNSLDFPTNPQCCIQGLWKFCIMYVLGLYLYH